MTTAVARPSSVSSAPTTRRQQAIYNFIRSEIIDKGRPPSVREIGKYFGISSPNGVTCHLKALEKKGLIRRRKNHARSIKVVGLDLEPKRSLRFLGQISAGRFYEAEEQEEVYDVEEMIEESDVIGQMVDDSLKHAQITQGDYLLFSHGRVIGLIRLVA